MGGGLMQLVAYGSQDVYLTGNPQITFFKAVYKRHTNFAMECIQQVFNGSPTLGAKSSVTVSRNGDLVNEVFLKFKEGNVLGDNSEKGLSGSWPAEAVVSEVELSIGGQSIDKHTREWLRLRDELYHNETQKNQYSKMTCVGSSMACRTAISDATFGPVSAANEIVSDLTLPFKFSFNVHPGLALPLIALQYHEVKLDVTFATNADSPWVGSTLGAVEMWCNYVYLDTDERRKFAQNQHEYLIEQVQRQQETLSGDGQTSKNVRLNFNHPVKELVWCFPCGNGTPCTIVSDPTDTSGPWGNFSAAGKVVRFTGSSSDGVPTTPFHQPRDCDGIIRIQGTADEDASAVFSSHTAPIEEVNGPLSNFKLQLNGHDRFAAQSSQYFNKVQPAFHHSGAPCAGVYCYSFALKPENHQPSGSCNFSRIDNATAVVQRITGLGGSNSTLNMYAVNYNVLRIMSGMGGLAYSN